MGGSWYDYGTSYYDAALARFTTIDPLTEKNHSQSGFVYGANNPIKYIDYMGLDSAQRANAVSQAEQYVSQKANGNMITDANKQLSNLSYDHNNMPTHIEISDHHKMEIDDIYSASGEKLKKIAHKDFQLLDKTDYILNFVYKNDKLIYVITEEGKITLNQEGKPLYEYDQKHLKKWT